MSVPALRFKDDSGNDFPEWGIQPLKEVSTITMGSSPSSNSYNEDGIGLPLIQGNADIKERLSSPRIFTSQITKECNEGDLLLSVRAPVGTIAISRHKACIGRGIASIRAKSNSLQEFLYQSLLELEPRWKSLSQGSTFEAVNSDEIKNIEISVPSIKEQSKIANFLTAVDEKITQLTKKQDLLTQYKKGVMQQIFSQELRFKDDDGQDFPEWKFCALGEAFEYKNGKSFENEVSENGNYFLVTLNSIDIAGKLKAEHKRVEKTDNSLHKNDLVMILSDVAHGNFLGLTDIIPSDMYVLNQRIGGLHAKVNLDVRFASSYINFNQKYFKLHGQGSSQLNLSKGDVLDFSLPQPHIKEQTKIANFLTAIDEKLTNTQSQLELVKQYKQGLLQQMFV